MWSPIEISEAITLAAAWVLMSCVFGHWKDEELGFWKATAFFFFSPLTLAIFVAATPLTSLYFVHAYWRDLVLKNRISTLN